MVFQDFYSSYIMINPNYILGYSHNIFLDASIQQGILAGLVLFWIYLGNILRLAQKTLPSAHSYLRLAILSSLLIITFHGFVDNILLRTVFTMLLFFIPGMAVGLIASINAEPRRIIWDKSQTHRLALPVIIALGLTIAGIFIFRRTTPCCLVYRLGSCGNGKGPTIRFSNQHLG